MTELDTTAFNVAWLERRAEAFRAQRFDWTGIGFQVGFLIGALFMVLIERLS